MGAISAAKAIAGRKERERLSKPSGAKPRVITNQAKEVERRRKEKEKSDAILREARTASLSGILLGR